MSVKKEENNLKKLARTNLATNFVKKCKGEWNHDEWLKFCDSIKKKGYSPIDLDQVGLLLENKRAEYCAKQTCACSN